ncbi:unnamed protein product [Prunus armeniaca]
MINAYGILCLGLGTLSGSCACPQTSIWQSWKLICNSIFNPGYEPPPNPHHTIRKFSSEWLDANNVINAKPTREVIQVHCSLPTLGNFKLNVDGSCKTDSWKICAGGFSDCQGLEQNRAADHLANLGYELPLGLHIYDSSPKKSPSRAVPC